MCTDAGNEEILNCSRMAQTCYCNRSMKRFVGASSAKEHCLALGPNYYLTYCREGWKEFSCRSTGSFVFDVIFISKTTK